MALCDIVYAADTATFTTPFMKLGFCAEGCASVVFPAVMGLSKVTLYCTLLTVRQMNCCCWAKR